MTVVLQSWLGIIPRHRFTEDLFGDVETLIQKYIDLQVRLHATIGLQGFSRERFMNQMIELGTAFKELKTNMQPFMTYDAEVSPGNKRGRSSTD